MRTSSANSSAFRVAPSNQRHRALTLLVYSSIVSMVMSGPPLLSWTTSPTLKSLAIKRSTCRSYNTYYGTLRHLLLTVEGVILDKMLYFVDISKTPLLDLQGFPALSRSRNIDKTMNSSKNPQTCKKTGTLVWDLQQQTSETRGETSSGAESECEYPTGLEIAKFISATKGSRFEARDRCLLLLMFRHSLRISEACRL